MANVMNNRQRETGDAGFTIIEMCVAMTILAIVAAGMSGVFWSAIRAAATASHRTDAAAIASREIESIRAVPYSQIGMYGDQTGYASTFEAYSTVTLASSTPAGTIPQIQPQRPDASAG